MKKGLIFIALWFIAATGFSQYYFNKAVQFGNGAYYSSVSQAQFNPPANGITIEAWVYLDTITTDMAIVGKNFATGYALTLREVSSTEAIIRFNMAGGFVNSTGTVKLHEWTHIAVSYDNINTVKFYLNGISTPVAFGSLAGAIPTNSDEFRIGADHFGGVPAFFFPGQIDEVRIWNGVRTDGEIASHKFVPLGVDNTTGTPYKQRHGFRMNMNSATDTLFSDCWPHYAMVPHNVTVKNYSDNTSPYVDYNNHLVFNGASGLKIESNFASSALTPGKSITIETWVRMDETVVIPFMNIFNQSGGNNDYPWGLYAVPATGEVYFDMNSGSDASISGGNIADQRWHHIAATCDNATGTAKLYIDGELIGSQTFDPNTQSMDQTTYPWYVGTIGATDFITNKFAGGIDEARLWRNTVRTQAEIKKYMYTGLDKNINDPDIDSLVVFNFDGTSRQSNEPILKKMPLLYGSFHEGYAFFSSSKANTVNGLTAPLLRYDSYNYPQDFMITDAKKAIADAAVTSDTLTVAGFGFTALSQIQVAVLLNHTYVGDLEAVLYSPSGDSIQLVGSGGCPGNDLITIFTSSADIVYQSSCSGVNDYTPSSPSIQPIGTFSSMTGDNPNGNWRLRITDVTSGDDGDFYAWGLRLVGNVSIDDPQAAATFDTYNFPNPAYDNTTIYFNLPQAEDVKLAIFDQAGRMIQQNQINGTSGDNYFVTDVSNFAAGIYYYQLTAGKYQANNKIVVNK